MAVDIRVAITRVLGRGGESSELNSGGTLGLVPVSTCIGGKAHQLGPKIVDTIVSRGLNRSTGVYFGLSQCTRRGCHAPVVTVSNHDGTARSQWEVANEHGND